MCLITKTVDSRIIRLFQAIILYIIFVLLYSINLEMALGVMSLGSAVIAFIHYHRDGLLKMEKKFVYNSLLFALIGGALIYLRQPTTEEVFSIVIKQGIAEEVIFRLGMLGILRRHLRVDSPLPRDTWLYIIGNSVLFMFLHPTIYIAMFVVSILYGYLFLKLGIFAAIVSHVLWNFSLNLYALAMAVFLIFIYEVYHQSRQRKKPYFRWYRR